MLTKILQRVEPIGLDNHRMIVKVFQRNLQTIESKSAFLNDKLYYRAWEIRDALGNVKKLSQVYEDGKPIYGSQSIINYYA